MSNILVILGGASSTTLVSCVLLGGILFLTVFFYRNKKSTEKLPPGPTPVPIFGNVLQFYDKPYRKFMEWATQYGPIFHIKMLNETMIVLQDAKLVKELFNHKLTTGRDLTNPIVYEMTKGPYGTANSIGSTWTEQRAFTLKTLQDSGFNKSSMEDMMIEEVKATLLWLSRREGCPLPGNRIFNEPVVNTLWNIVAGERHEWENGHSDVVSTFGNMIQAFQRVTTNGLAFLPFLRFIFPGLMGWNEYVKRTDAVQQIFVEAVNKRSSESGGGGGTRGDFIDAHLAEIEGTTDPNSSFYKEAGYKNLMVGLFDLFLGGSETSSLTLSWAFLYLSLHPEIQKEMHSESCRVLGDRLPELSDRQQMPFVEAVIMETMRKSSIVALGVPHVVLEDIEFKGYTFKKDTKLIANLFGIHHDPKVWKDPEEFRPSRFLGKDGTKLGAHESLIPFLEGKRKCIGEKMSREQLFLFMAGITQKYWIKLEGDPKIEKGFKEMMMKPGSGNFLLIPKEFQVVLLPKSTVKSL